ncbi:MAG: polymorphic toxin type 44 domain-containing protein [Xanthomonadaceae bacterium]|nr:polymorphic toxin type 44 domain-containing protein [Xanthomonadaceae bacterium]
MYYYHTDALRSAMVVTDANHNVVERTYYGPYGEVLNRSLRDGPGYAGHEEDAATGLDNMQQRYYDPGIGRFLSVDPVTATSAGGNFNRYWYADDNPYRYTDPDGRCTGSHISTGDGTCASTGGFTTGTSGAAQGMQRQQAMRGALAKYSSVINYGHVNIDANVKTAQQWGAKHDLSDFVGAVRKGGKWDFKDQSVFQGFRDKKLLAEFGNFHFGLVAHAFGFSEGTAIFGAGAYQTFVQGHTPGNRLRGDLNFAGSAALGGAAFFVSDKVATF